MTLLSSQQFLISQQNAMKIFNRINEKFATLLCKEEMTLAKTFMTSAHENLQGLGTNWHLNSSFQTELLISNCG